MKVQIAVRNVQSEVEIDVDLTLEDLKKAFTDAVETGKPLILSDKDGRTVFIPADAVGYISTSTGETRRVGFGFTS